MAPEPAPPVAAVATGGALDLSMAAVEQRMAAAVAGTPRNLVPWENLKAMTQEGINRVMDETLGPDPQGPPFTKESGIGWDVSTEPKNKADMIELAEKLNPVVGFWDPLNIITEDTSPETIGWWRHAECAARRQNSGHALPKRRRFRAWSRVAQDQARPRGHGGLRRLLRPGQRCPLLVEYPGADWRSDGRLRHALLRRHLRRGRPRRPVGRAPNGRQGADHPRRRLPRDVGRDVPRDRGRRSEALRGSMRIEAARRPWAALAACSALQLLR